MIVSLNRRPAASEPKFLQITRNQGLLKIWNSWSIFRLLLFKTVRNELKNMVFGVKKAKEGANPVTALAVAFFVRLGTASWVAVASLLLSACLLDPDQGGSKVKPWDGTPGYVSLQVSLERNQNHGLGKVSASDTTFGLDSLLIVLSATGADTVIYRYAISGRPDTGAITVSPKIFALNPLLNWKARIYTIDTTASPVVRDTVHIDSVTFAIRPGDTTLVDKEISAAFSVIHTRFYSSSRDELGAGIRYVRIRINGVTRDSVEMRGGVYNAIWFVDYLNGWVVQDSGRIYNTVDSGVGWYAQTSGTTRNLRAVAFTNTTTGLIAGDSGTILRTTNAGVNWTSQTSGTTRRLNRIHYGNSSTVYAVGDSGTVLKSIDGGVTWLPRTGGWFPQTSGTPYGLSDVAFTSLDSGVAVGYGGVIRSTTNAGGTWSTVTSPVVANLAGIHFGTLANGWAVGDTGKIIVTTNRGYNWTAQTSPTRKDLSGIFFTNATTGWAAGKSETLLRTTNGGTTWLDRSSGWADQTSNTTKNLKAVHFTSAANGIAVGATGEIRNSTNNGVTWSNVSAPTSKNLNDVHFFTGSAAGWAVGDSDVVIQTGNSGSSWTEPTKSGWYSQANGVANVQLNAVHFTAATTGIAVGAAGAIEKTSNFGVSWDAPVTGNGSTTLNDVHFSGTSAGWAVGDSETVLRTANTGANWTSSKGGWFVPSTNPTGDLNAVHFTSATTGWAAGASGNLWKTSNNGVTWTNQSGNVTPSNSNTLGAVHAMSTSNAVAVGDGESIMRTINGGTNWNFYPVGFSAKTTDLGPTNTIHAVRFVDNTNGWAVADSGKILKTTDRGENWSQPWAATNKKPLRGVFGWGQNHAVVAGDSGIIKRTTNGGTSWSAMTSGVTTDLRGLYFTGATGWAVGGTGGTVRFTNDSGKTWAAQTGAGGSLNAVYSNGTRVWMVGDGGVIYRRTGITNAALSSVNNGAINTQNLYGVYFTSNNVGYIVGAGGLIAKCASTNNNNWTVRTSGVATDLRHIFFKGAGGAANDTGYAVGDGGVVLRTHDSGFTWKRLTSGTTENLRALTLSTTNRDTVYAVGTNGKIIKTLTGGTWSGGGPRNLNDVFFYSAAGGFAVGDTGTILRTNNTAASWVPLNSRVTTKLNAVYSDGTRAWAVGNSSTVRHIAAITDTGWTSAAGDLPANINLYGVHFTTATRGYVVGAGGKIYMTTNNGTNWTLQGSGVTVADDSLYSVSFRGTGSNDTGFISGKNGTLLRTIDGGSNWIRMVSGTTETLRGIQTTVGGASVDTTYAVGTNGKVLKTISRGYQWSGKVSPQTLRGTHLYSTTAGFAVGDSGSIIRSTNSGVTFTSNTSGVTSRLNAVFADNTFNAAWAVGDGGVVLKSPSVSTPVWSAATTVTGTPRLLAVHFTSYTNSTTARGYVAGADGKIFMTTDNGGTWTQQGSGVTTDTLYSLSFRGAGTNDTGYAVGKAGTILRTINGGATWVKLFNGSNANLTGVFTNVTGTSIDTTYAVGSGGTVLKTITRGTSWGRRVSPQTLRGVHMYSASSGFVVGDSGTSVRTSNSGVNWIVSDSGITAHLNAVYSDGTRAWAVGRGGVVRHIATVATVPWASAAGTMPATVNLYGVQFTSYTNASTAVGYAVGYNTSGGVGVVYKTTNNGTNWNALTLGVSVTDTLRTLFFKGTGGATDTGYVTGDNGTILYTTNSGTSWTKHQVATTDGLSGVHAGAGGSMDTAFAVGTNGTILKTYNAGVLFSGAAARRDFLGTSFPTASIGYVFGTGGTILKTTNAGVTWVSQANPITATGNYLYGGHFFSPDTGWAVGSGGKIVKTTNGGTSWIEQTSGTAAFLYRVKFIGRDTGWVVGIGTILKTTDGGGTWVAQNTSSTAYLSGLYASNVDSVVAVGFGEATGTILKTRNGGVANIGTPQLNGVFARSADSVYVVGNGGAAFRSRDGGGSWQQLTGVAENLNGVFSAGSTTYLAGDAGRIATITHTNSGVALTSPTPVTTRNLRAVWGSPTPTLNRVYVAGDSGAVAIKAGSDPWLALNGTVTDAIRGIHCAGSVALQDWCWFTGENEMVLRANGINVQAKDLYMQTAGSKIFDVRLSSKYLKPGVANTVLIQAIDRDKDLPLRGYEKTLTVTVGAGQDSTLNTQLLPCGYGGGACTP
jgi:photosystem II stability/assembly factor-like uncharacterized protein